MANVLAIAIINCQRQIHEPCHNLDGALRDNSYGF